MVNKDYSLVFSRKMWENLIRKGLYSFTKDQLDKADSDDRGYIGAHRYAHSATGVNCYIQKPFGDGE